MLKKSKILGVLALAALVSSCSLKSNGQQQTVTIALPGAQFSFMEKMTEWMSLAWASTTTVSSLSTDPASLSEFDCFGVNVSGPGIAPDPNVSCTDSVDAPAILGGFVPNGNSSIDLIVPAGPNRSIKIFGVKSLVGCPNLHDMLHDGAINFNNLGHFYDIGGTHTDIFADTDVNIKVTYSASSPKRAFEQCKRNGEIDYSHIWNVFASTGPGNIDVTKTVNGTSFIGGKFDYVGPTTLSGALISQSSGAISSGNYPAHISGTVRCSVPDGHGGFYVGGSFSHVESTSYSPPAGLIHIAFDGSFDPTFVVQTSSGGSVYSCAFDGTTLYLGGSFTNLSVNGATSVTSNSLAAIPIATLIPQDMGSVISTSSPLIYGMDVDRLNNRLYVGGSFTLTGALTSHSNAVAFSTSTGYAAISTWHPDPNASVSAVYADSVTGDVYLGGSFTNSGHSYLFRAGSAGTIQTWSPSIPNYVGAITKDGSNVYVATFDASNFPQVYRIDSTTAALSGNPLSAGATNEVFDSLALSSDGTQLYVGGKFLISGHQNLISILNPAGTATINSGFTANSASGSMIYAITPNSVGKLFVGGNFPSLGGVIRKNIAAIDLNSGQATGWISPYSNIGEVTALESDGSSIYAAYDANSTATIAPGVMKISAGADASAGWNDSTSSYASDHMFGLALNGGALYCGGTFTYLSGVGSLSNVARINTSTGAVDTSWKPVVGTTSSRVTQIVAAGGSVYLGGNFASINGGTTMNSLVSIDSSTAALVSGWNNPVITSGVDSMIAIAPNTYSFAPNGGLLVGTSTQLKLVDATTGSPSAWAGVSLSTLMFKTYRLAQSGDTLYIGGQANGTTGQALVAYDLSTQTFVSGFTPDIQNGYVVTSIELLGPGAMLVGGNFQQVNTISGSAGKMSWGIGLFDAATGVFY